MQIVMIIFFGHKVHIFKDYNEMTCTDNLFPISLETISKSRALKREVRDAEKIDWARLKMIHLHLFLDPKLEENMFYLSQTES